MRILLLSDVNSIHTKRWATALRQKGIEVGLFSLTRPAGTGDAYLDIEVFSHGIPDKFLEGLTLAGKLRYFTSLPFLKRCIREFRPDIVHAHYASSYGTLGALTGFHPYLLSVWGSDVYTFPKRSALKGWLIRRNFRKADLLLSTSHAMAGEASLYTEKEFTITPFGIDLQKFSPGRSLNRITGDSLVIGTTKSLEEVYGIRYLIDAFALVRKSNPGIPVKLLICSGGSLELRLKEQTRLLGLEEDVIFEGKITHDQVPECLGMMDVFVAPSLRESFGVAVIEASACEVPVVASDTGGLKEVVEEGVTGLLVPPGNAEKMAEAIGRLIADPILRKELGKNGRERVKRLYEWNENVDRMISVYKTVLCDG